LPCPDRNTWHGIQMLAMNRFIQAVNWFALYGEVETNTLIMPADAHQEVTLHFTAGVEMLTGVRIIHSVHRI